MTQNLSDSISAILLQTFALVLSAMLAGCSASNNTPAAPAYYVDATAGLDTNSGLSPFAPLKTLSKLSISIFESGSTIFLKRGETWYEQLNIPSSGVNIDAYGSGDLPVIDGSVDIESTGWTDLNGGIYSKFVTLASSGEGLGNISDNGSLLNFVAWNVDCITTLTSAANGSYTYGYPDLMCIKAAAAPAIANVYRASKKFYGISAISKSNISIKNVLVQRFSLNGINFVDCDTCSVLGVVARQGGGATIAANLYAGNGVECDKSCKNILFDALTISDIFDSGISPQTYGNNQTASNIAIQNSTVDRAGFAGVEISVLSNGGSTGSSISNVTISGLMVTNSGKGWSGRRYGTDGHGLRIIADTGAGTMSNVLVQDITVSGSAGDGIKLGGEIGTITINRARVKTNSVGINVEAATATTLKLVLSTSLIYNNNSYGVNFNAPSAGGFNLFHNTFYNNNLINFAVFNQAGQAKLQNNIFYSSVPMAHLYVATALAGGIVNNNCYNDQAGMIGYGMGNYSSVEIFRMNTSFEANGYGGSNVGMTLPDGENFSLLASSQCKALGVNGLGVTVDYLKKNYSIPPSSGAYQL